MYQRTNQRKETFRRHKCLQFNTSKSYYWVEMFLFLSFFVLESLLNQSHHFVWMLAVLDGYTVKAIANQRPNWHPGNGNQLLIHILKSNKISYWLIVIKGSFWLQNLTKINIMDNYHLQESCMSHLYINLWYSLHHFFFLLLS